MRAAPPGRPEAVTFHVRHVTYASRDGVTVRMFILSRGAVSRSIPLWLDQLCFFARQLGL